MCSMLLLLTNFILCVKISVNGFLEGINIMNINEIENYKNKIEKRSEELTAEELELIAGGVSGAKKGLASALAVAALSAAPSVNAQSTLSINNTGYSQVEIYDIPVTRYAYVSNVVDLKKALRNSDIDYIVVTRDLYIKEDVRFPNDRKVTLDLRGNTVHFLNPSVQFIMGDKYEVKIPYTVHHDGHWKEEKIGREIVYGFNAQGEKIVKSEKDVFKKIWVPPFDELKYKTEFRYYKDAELTVKNGEIIGCDGKNGASKNEVRFFRSSVSGEDGQTPSALFKAISGKLYLSNIKLTTGNGGNGGNAFYSTELHIPIIGRGNGGDGGNGGNGGDAFEAEECEITTSDVTFNFGKGGNGGNGSRPNPSAWLNPGFRGDRGSNGRMGNYGVYNLI